MAAAAIVIPCFNEERRLDTQAVAALVARRDLCLVLVDDGSKDGTRALLHRLAAQWPQQVEVLGLDQNQGKAEAVRQGLLLATQRAPLVGFADADFATPPGELMRLLDVLEGGEADVVLGSRVALSGHAIDRKPSRHYLGRIFGTVASLLLQASIYDTQCGAKFFRVTPLLADALRTPFSSRWLFDVELLGRLLIGAPGLPGVPTERLHEVPLRMWRDVRGSKLGARAMARVPLELARIRIALERRRSRLTPVNAD